MGVFQYWPVLLKGVHITLLITFASFAIGAVLAVFVTLGVRSPWRVLRGISTSYVELLRAVPVLPWLFLVFFGLPELGITLEPIPASIVVFSFVGSAYLTEIYRAGLRAVPSGQTEAGAALGLSRAHTYRYVIVPQAVRTISPLALAYLLGLLKDSAIASVIGVMDITGLAVVETRATMQGLQVFLSAAALYLLLSIPIAAAGRVLAARYLPSHDGRA